MSKIVDGKKIAKQTFNSLKKRIERLKRSGASPALAVVLVGNDGPSRIYVGKKAQAAKKIGITFLRFEYPASIPKTKLVQELLKIQKDNKLSGLIVQLPLPQQLQRHTQEILNTVNPKLDIDFLTEASMGTLALGTNQLTPPTAGAIFEVLRSYKISLAGKHVCIVGRGNLVGKPLTNLFMREPVTLTVCGSNTKHLTNFTKQADIVISAVGKPKLIRGSMIKKGAVVIDAGTSSASGTLVGDIDFESVHKRSSLVTPTPGGVGPVTIAKLLENVVKNAEEITSSSRGAQPTKQSLVSRNTTRLLRKASQ